MELHQIISIVLAGNPASLAARVAWERRWLGVRSDAQIIW
jgi:hypothetical protein